MCVLNPLPTQPAKKPVVIMRRPCLMEDEGRHFYERTCPDRESAEKWIAAQKDEYFKPGDYYIAEAL